MALQSGLCQTWSETPKTGFLMTRLYFNGTIDYAVSSSSVIVKSLLGDFFFISWFTDPPTQIFHFRKKLQFYFLLFLFSPM